MKRLFLGSVALVALSLGTSAAFAADRRVPAYTPPPPPVPVYTWSGCYVGASAGTSQGHSDGFSTTATSTAAGLGGLNAPVFGGQQVSQQFDLSGFIGGFQGGCNWQAGAWVFGIEGDGSATNKSGQAFPAVPTLLSTIPAGVVTVNQNDVFQLQERWLVTARGRLGLTGWWGDRTLLYVTGGAAWAKIDSSFWVNGNPIVTGVQQSHTRDGWTVGGGIEYAVGYGWSVKGEYLYVDFGDFTTLNCTAPSPGCAFGTITSLNVNLKDHIWRAGMNYKFW
jgi:outer membrane immunogenic protein